MVLRGVEVLPWKPDNLVGRVRALSRLKSRFKEDPFWLASQDGLDSGDRYPQECSKGKSLGWTSSASICGIESSGSNFHNDLVEVLIDGRV